MVLDLINKVAIVTGGISGIGLAIGKVLLRKGVKGVCLADINVENSKKVLQEFGKEKVIFAKTDVADINNFENAFKSTLSKFHNIDVLVNNAGILDEKNRDLLFDINLKGVLNGMILGLEKYLRMYKQDQEAVILNTSSIFGVSSPSEVPVYVASKHAVVGMTRSWGDPFHFHRTKVRVMAICPGITESNIFSKNSNIYGINEEYLILKSVESLKIQSAEHVGKEAVRIIEKASNGTIWVIENTEPCYQYIFPDRSTFKNNVLSE